MKTYLQPKMDVELIENNILTDIIVESGELPPYGGDFGEVSD